KQKDEEYTYGEDIEHQLQPLIDMYKKGYETNQACMTIGSKHSIHMADPPCLRVIDTRVRYGQLHFMLYFRSWDLWGGFPSNLAALQLLKEHIASEIGVDDGEMIACSKGLHLYGHTWELANLVLKREG
ncbi:MAG: thymidylate synthase, partial [Chloroflexota bacterium]